MISISLKMLNLSSFRAGEKENMVMECVVSGVISEDEYGGFGVRLCTLFVACRATKSFESMSLAWHLNPTKQ